MHRQGGRVALLATFLTSTAAIAQTPNDVLLGGRTATMGGASTAAGNDSAMPYLNPAGLAGLPGDVFAVSSSIYARTTRSYDNLFAPNGYAPEYGSVEVTKDEIDADTLVEIPSAVMYVKHLSAADAKTKHFAGVSLVIPVAYRERLQTQFAANVPAIAGTVSQEQALSIDATHYYLGANYGLALGDDLRLGAGLHLMHAQAHQVLNRTSTILTFNGALPAGSTGQGSSQSRSTALVPIVGVQANVISNLWLGTGIAGPSMHLYGERTALSESSGVDVDVATGQPISFKTTATSAEDYRLKSPLRVNVGAAWDDRERFSAAVDLHVLVPRPHGVETDGVVTTTEARTGETARTVRTSKDAGLRYDPTTNISVGVEYALSSLVALRGGFFTDMTNLRHFGPNSESTFLSVVDRIGATLGAGLNTGSFDTTWGVFYAHGWGEFYTVDAWSSSGGTAGVAPVDVRSHTIGLVLSSSVTTREAKKTIQGAVPVKAEAPVNMEVTTP